jgi:hypothetical protein
VLAPALSAPRLSRGQAKWVPVVTYDPASQAEPVSTEQPRAGDAPEG